MIGLLPQRGGDSHAPDECTAETVRDVIRDATVASRCRLWKIALQELANRLGIPIHVCHGPPGTSKWNKIEHRIFCHITQNWRGRPLVSHQVIVNLIADTTTRQGLKIRAQLGKRRYPKEIKITDAKLKQVHLKPHAFHGEWNYTITPTRSQK